MFVNECNACHRRQLIFPSQITSVVDAGTGSAVRYTCWCGADQVWVADRSGVTGRPLVAA